MVLPVKKKKDPFTYSAETKRALMRWPTICGRYCKDGSCEKCNYRMHRLSDMQKEMGGARSSRTWPGASQQASASSSALPSARDKRESFHVDTGALNATMTFQKTGIVDESRAIAHFGLEEMDLYEYDDGELGDGRLIAQQPLEFDMIKVRALFGLIDRPPRKHNTLLGSRAALDKKRFILTQSTIFDHYQVKCLSDALMSLVVGNDDGAWCTLHHFEKAIATTGLMKSLTHRKILRAFDKLQCLERWETKFRSFWHEGTSIPLDQNHRKHRVQRSRSVQIQMAEDAVRDGGESTFLRETLIKSFEVEPMQAELSVPHFHLRTWWRASEHCCVQIDCRIEVGEDVEWCFVIKQDMDEPWPFNALGLEMSEEDGEDDASIYRGIFFGVTSRPHIVVPYVHGPDCTLIGYDAHDGSIVNRGTVVGKYLPLKCGGDQKLHLGMRLDRRPYSVDTHKHACRLWIKHPEVDEAIVLIDNMEVDAGVDLYPCIYASRPETDVRYAVSLRGKGCSNLETDGPWGSFIRSLDTDDEYLWREDPTVGESLTFQHMQDMHDDSEQSLIQGGGVTLPTLNLASTKRRPGVSLKPSLSFLPEAEEL